MQSVHSTVYGLLVLNEVYRKSDSDLLSELISLLADNPKAVNNITKSRNFSVIARYRSQYNRGLLCSKKPEVVSFRYENGKAVNRHDRPLTIEELKRHASYYPTNAGRDLRFEPAEMASILHSES